MILDRAIRRCSWVTDVSQAFHNTTKDFAYSLGVDLCLTRLPGALRDTLENPGVESLVSMDPYHKRYWVFANLHG